MISRSGAKMVHPNGKMVEYQYKEKVVNKKSGDGFYEILHVVNSFKISKSNFDNGMRSAALLL